MEQDNADMDDPQEGWREIDDVAQFGAYIQEAANRMEMSPDRSKVHKYAAFLLACTSDTLSRWRGLKRAEFEEIVRSDLEKCL